MTLSTEQQEIYVSIWQKAVDTQVHFNEMSVKARQFGLTFVAAALGFGVVMLNRGEEFSLLIPAFGGLKLDATVIIVLVSALALYAVRHLDINVYHKMLRGAVTFGEDFEKNYMAEIFNLQKGMTQAISHYSRYEDADVSDDGGRYIYTGKCRVNAEMKIRAFYKLAIWSLVTIALGLFVITNSPKSASQSASPPVSSNKAQTDAK
jgi:hypothetical protein